VEWTQVKAIGNGRIRPDDRLREAVDAQLPADSDRRPSIAAFAARTCARGSAKCPARAS
jgi:hypothetical protein